MTVIDRSDTFIRNLGLDAYRVGGSVRDELLGRKAKDADYIVRGLDLTALGNALDAALIDYRKNSLTPLELRDGRQAGWRVWTKDFGVIEVVLPRVERPRPPAPGESLHSAFDIVVDPDITLAEDATRRDFTFNALYIPVSEGVFHLVQDPTGRGLYDLSHKLINTTHPDSFRDDPLRTLRALRFVSVLGYELGTNAREQMEAHADRVTGLSAKGFASGTIYEEMSKLLMGLNAVDALRLGRDTGVLGSLFPALKPMFGFEQGSRYHDLTTDEHTFKAMEVAVNVDAPLEVRWALLFHDSGKPYTAWIGTDGRKHYYEPSDEVWAKVGQNCSGYGHDVQFRKPRDHEVESAEIWSTAARWMNVPNNMRKAVRSIILEHMVSVVKPKQTKVNRARVRLGDDLLRMIYMHRMCDLSGKDEKVCKKHLDNIVALERMRSTAAENGVPCSLKDLAVNGNDVRQVVKDARDTGRVLHALLDEVACDPTDLKRSREWQLARAEALA